MDSGQIILFQTQGGETKIEVRLANESVWLTADQMAELFQCNSVVVKNAITEVTVIQPLPDYWYLMVPAQL